MHIYHNNAEDITGQVGSRCRNHGRRFVFSTAHDWDCQLELPHLPGWRERTLYHSGYGSAARGFRDLTDGDTGTSASPEFRFAIYLVIPMPCPLSVLTPASLEDRPRPYRILWVGRIVENKRLEMFLHLAERAPELTFEVAGTPEDASNYGLEMLERARSLPNVVWHGRVARERMPALYRAALCLCCTATLEGFPNTFLEAWSEGTPVVSTFDPDQLIRSGELGAVGNTADDLLRSDQAPRQLR